MDISQSDPKGLLREAYRIEGITLPECRTIFLDWAIGLPKDADPALAIQGALAHYSTGAEDHPMTQVLTEGLGQAAAPRRRGGRAARFQGKDQA